MKEKLKELAQARWALGELRALEMSRQENMEQTPEGMAYLETKCKIKELEQDIEVIDADIRSWSLVQYHLYNERNPIDHVKIKVMRKMIFDEDEAKSWCLEHNPVMLKLDTPKFKRFVRAVDGIQDVDCVELYNEPIATIARDLSDVLE